MSNQSALGGLGAGGLLIAIGMSVEELPIKVILIIAGAIMLLTPVVAAAYVSAMKELYDLNE